MKVKNLSNLRELILIYNLGINNILKKLLKENFSIIYIMRKLVQLVLPEIKQFKNNTKYLLSFTDFKSVSNLRKKN